MSEHKFTDETATVVALHALVNDMKHALDWIANGLLFLAAYWLISAVMDLIWWGKNPENRVWSTSYRGPLAIHAGRTFEDAALQDPTLRAALPRDAAGAKAAFDQRHILGAFVGVVDLVDVHEAFPETHAFESTYSAACCSSPWAQFDGVRAHFELANPRPLVEPVPARGRLGLWTPSPEQALAIVERIGHAA